LRPGISSGAYKTHGSGLSTGGANGEVRRCCASHVELILGSEEPELDGVEGDSILMQEVLLPRHEKERLARFCFCAEESADC
jgi:hypothetical protein